MAKYGIKSPPHTQAGEISHNIPAIQTQDLSSILKPFNNLRHRQEDSWSSLTKQPSLISGHQVTAGDLLSTNNMEPMRWLSG